MCLLQDLLVRCWALSAVTSDRWDAELGPALSAVSEDVEGETLAPCGVRDALCSLTDSGRVEIDAPRAASFLAAAGVHWA